LTKTEGALLLLGKARALLPKKNALEVVAVVASSFFFPKTTIQTTTTNNNNNNHGAEPRKSERACR
jgi:hypothetical protein